MRGKPKKTPRQKDLTSDYMSGSLDEDRVESQERFTDRSKHAQRDKMMKTAEMRAGAEQAAGDLDALPTGRVIQIYSLYCNVLHEGHTYLCVIRKTMVKVHGEIIVGDLVRFRVDPDLITQLAGGLPALPAYGTRGISQTAVDVHDPLLSVVNVTESGDLERGTYTE